MRDKRRRLQTLERRKGQDKTRVIVLDNDEPEPPDVTPCDIIVRFRTNVDMSKL